jgi:hypothetical protein
LMSKAKNNSSTASIKIARQLSLKTLCIWPTSFGTTTIYKADRALTFLQCWYLLLYTLYVLYLKFQMCSELQMRFFWYKNAIKRKDLDKC